AFRRELGDLRFGAVGDPHIAGNVEVYRDVGRAFFFFRLGETSKVLAFFRELLDSVVATVGDVHTLVVEVVRDAVRAVELAVARPLGPVRLFERATAEAEPVDAFVAAVGGPHVVLAEIARDTRDALELARTAPVRADAPDKTAGRVVLLETTVLPVGDPDVS